MQKKDKNSQQHQKWRPANNLLPESRRNSFYLSKATEAELHWDIQSVLHLVKHSSHIHLKSDRKTLPFSYYFPPAQRPKTKPNKNLALYYGCYSLDEPENCSVSPNLSTSIPRMQFLGNRGAGSRRGPAIAHHILEVFFPHMMLHRQDKSSLCWKARFSHTPSVLNVGERAEEVEGDPTSVQQDHTRWISAVPRNLRCCASQLAPQLQT